jgi:hypothetical protein
MSSFTTYKCSSDNCDFQVDVGHFHGEPGPQVFCDVCFKKVYLEEVYDPADPDFMSDVRVLRILKVIPPDRPTKLTPKQRRMAREAGQIPPPRHGWPIPMVQVQATGEYVFWQKRGGPIVDIETGACPECGSRGSISTGFRGETCSCPKCWVGTIVSEYWE